MATYPPGDRYVIGHDFEFWTKESVPDEFRLDSSVPIEISVEPDPDPEVLYKNTVEVLGRLAANVTHAEGGARRSGYFLGGHLHFGGMFEVNANDRRVLDSMARIVRGVSNHKSYYLRLEESRYGILQIHNGYHRDREHKPYGFEYRALPSPANMSMLKAYFALASVVGRIVAAGTKAHLVLRGAQHPCSRLYKKLSQAFRKRWNRETDPYYLPDAKEDNYRIGRWYLKKILSVATPQEAEGLAYLRHLYDNHKVAKVHNLLDHPDVERARQVCEQNTGFQVLGRTGPYTIVCGRYHSLYGYVSPDFGGPLLYYASVLDAYAGALEAEGHLRSSKEDIADNLKQARLIYLLLDGKTFAAGAALSHDNRFFYFIVRQDARGKGLGTWLFKTAMCKTKGLQSHIPLTAVCVDGGLSMAIIKKHATVIEDRDCGPSSVFADKTLRLLTFYP